MGVIGVMEVGGAAISQYSIVSSCNADLHFIAR